MKKAPLLPLLLCLSLAYAQESYTYLLQSSGDSLIAASISPITGNFSAYNLKESNPDFISLLFGGPAMSSHIAYTIDGRPVHQSNLQIKVPLGPTAGSQIDGVFTSAEGIHIETAYFLMGAGTKGGLTTLGLAILISNTSSNQNRRVGVKIMLDTEISELKNTSLLHLPSGQRLQRPFRFTERNIPEYLFIGERDSASGLSEGKGFYIYPYLSTNFPSIVVAENWRRLASSPWAPQNLGADFSYQGKGLLDAGLGIYFGEYTLKPGKEITLGAAVSLDKIVTVPVLKEAPRTLLSDTALARGVFAPERYLVNEMLAKPNSEFVQELLSQKKLPQIIPGRGLELSAVNSNTNKAVESDSPLLEFRSSDPFSRQILKMDSTMDQLRRLYDENMGFNPGGTNYTYPPYQGITERYYQE